MRKKFFIISVLALIFVAIFTACLPSENGDESGNGDGETPSQQKTYNLSDPLITISVKDRFDIVYNGTALECSFDLRYDGRIIDTFTAGTAHPDLTAEFSDNVNAGNAKITLSGTSTKKYTGTAEFTFEILQSKEKKTVASYSELEKELSLLNYTSFSLSGDISVPENKTLTVPSSTTLDLNGHLLTVEGTFINEGRITAESVSDKDFSVVNEGVFVNRHSLSLKFGTAFYNCGELRNEGTFDSASSKGVFSDVAMVGMDEYDFVYRRINMTECEGSLSYVSAEYDGKAKEPAVSFTYGGKPLSLNGCEISYSDNVNAGTATVSVTSGPHSKELVGHKEFTFAITPSSITVLSTSRLIETVSSGNYSEVTFNGSGSISGEFTVPSSTTVVLDGSFTNNATLTINGSLVVNDAFYNNATVANFGTLTVESGGKFHNSGVLTNDADFVNRGEFHNKNSFTNNFDAENSGKIYNYGEAEFNSVNAITNSGNAYFDENNPAFTDGLTVRQLIQEEDVSLKQTLFTYDGFYKYPTLVFSDDSLTVARNTYNLSYAYPDYPQREDPCDAGTVVVAVTFNGTSETYKGSLTLSYVIEPASAKVTDDASLRAILANGNYNEAVLDADVSLDSDLTIPQNYRVTVPAEYYLLTEYALTVEGQLENNGKFSLGNSGTLAGSENVINNGFVYFNGTEQQVSGSGTVFVRKSIASVTVSGLAATVMYGEDARLPFTLSDGGYTLIKGEDYSALYYNISDISVEGAPAYVISKAAVFSESYYGERRDEYLILPGEITVNTFEQLQNALADCREENVCNYGKIFLGASISFTNDTVSNITLTVAENTVLDLNSHKLSLRRGETSLHRFVYLVNNGEILIYRPLDLSTSYGAYSGTGEVVAYIDNTLDADSVNALAQNATLIRLKGDFETLDINVSFGEKVRITLDLCGHSVARLSLKVDKAALTVLSSVAGGKVTELLSIYGIINGSIDLQNFSAKSIDYDEALRPYITISNVTELS